MSKDKAIKVKFSDHQKRFFSSKYKLATVIPSVSYAATAANKLPRWRQEAASALTGVGQQIAVQYPSLHKIADYFDKHPRQKRAAKIVLVSTALEAFAWSCVGAIEGGIMGFGVGGTGGSFLGPAGTIAGSIGGAITGVAVGGITGAAAGTAAGLVIGGTAAIADATSTHLRGSSPLDSFFEK